MYFFNGKTIEVENIQIIKVDQMIVFYNAMWSITAHSRIRPFFVRWKPVNKGEGTAGFQRTKNGRIREWTVIDHIEL